LHNVVLLIPQWFSPRPLESCSPYNFLHLRGFHCGDYCFIRFLLKSFGWSSTFPPFRTPLNEPRRPAPYVHRFACFFFLPFDFRSPFPFQLRWRFQFSGCFEPKFPFSDSFLSFSGLQISPLLSPSPHGPCRLFENFFQSFSIRPVSPVVGPSLFFPLLTFRGRFTCYMVTLSVPHPQPPEPSSFFLPRGFHLGAFPFSPCNLSWCNGTEFSSVGF